MNTQTLHEVELVEPSEPTILVRRSADAISDYTLRVVREISRVKDDALRLWMRGIADAEIARRNVESGEQEEPAALRLPWHAWNDAELAAALVTSYAWYDVTDDTDTLVVLREIHRAVVTACATRLGELHDAIQRGRRDG